MVQINSRSAYQRALLIPLSLGLAFLLLTFIALIYLHNHYNEKEARTHTLQAVHQSLALAVDRDSDKLKALLKVLVDAPELQTLFRQRDREKLLAATQKLFLSLRNEHNITHFYFITPEREMFLRVHRPERFGDMIKRNTLLEAERTKIVTSGLELGALGVFTLRVVSPWSDQARNLLGYIELGMEIDKTLAQLHELRGVELLMLVEKKHLDRVRWEEGMEMVGHLPDWDRYPDHVLVGKTTAADPELLQYHRLSGAKVSSPPGSPFEIVVRGKTIEFEDVPMRDFAGKEVGTMVLLADLTEKRAGEYRLIFSMFGIVVLVWIVIMLTARSVVDHVYDSLVRTATERDGYLQQSQTDSLTELLNQTAFYHALDRDIEGCRLHNRTLTVLMLDIDHFKQVNDTHGHLAGDMVLRDISSLLRENARPRDSVGRYGGEEFTIILPQTTMEDAFNVAERIRQSTEDRIFVAAGKNLRITVSIGVASFPQHGKNSEQVVDAADRALYAAKAAGRNRVVISSAIGKENQRHE